MNFWNERLLYFNSGMMVMGCILIGPLLLVVAVPMIVILVAVSGIKRRLDVAEGQ